MIILLPLSNLIRRGLFFFFFFFYSSFVRKLFHVQLSFPTHRLLEQFTVILLPVAVRHHHHHSFDHVGGADFVFEEGHGHLYAYGDDEVENWMSSYSRW